MSWFNFEAVKYSGHGSSMVITMGVRVKIPKLGDTFELKPTSKPSLKLY